MDLTSLGHACFRMRGREGVVLADPPDPKSGHAIPKTDAAIVTISHDHPGHSSLKSVGGEPVVLRGPGEYEIHEVLVTGIRTFHDDSKGTARGRNTVFAIPLDDLVIVHLGDLEASFATLPFAPFASVAALEPDLRRSRGARKERSEQATAGLPRRISVRRRGTSRRTQWSSGRRRFATCGASLQSAQAVEGKEDFGK